MKFYFNDRAYCYWKHIKLRIKNVLDSKQVSREEKILIIESLLEDYKNRYLK